eukprot:TRINITY_DN3176_c1_g1_i5.p1 TRINITY_DN3176_c1_g1~~TRINITY_DN3176_c1_g1_i5.p1  ORF type:complete len:419 (-),score=94.51 TRINITY_DN3176_c1_g1_i5:62-1318(-)
MYAPRPAQTHSALVIGAGPAGLRMAVELALLGSSVVIIEKRKEFSRNNVLKLWPTAVADLKLLGVKHLYPGFCVGGLEHIALKPLQTFLAKVISILGVRLYPGVAFLEFVEPSAANPKWSARCQPPLPFNFSIVVGGDGTRNNFPGFERTAFRGKLALGITANFVRGNSKEESKCDEIGGLSYQYNQEFFRKMNELHRVSLENIVYYRDETHYFVFTAKKESLLEWRVLKQDRDWSVLLTPDNVDRERLKEYITTTAKYATNLPDSVLKNFALTPAGNPDIDLFDFTNVSAAKHAMRIEICEKFNSASLAFVLVGDSLLEPFWPLGTGVNKAILSVQDAAWALCKYCLAVPHGNASRTPDSVLIDLLKERDDILRLLAQIKPDTLRRPHTLHTIDPSSRYITIPPARGPPPLHLLTRR